jgi:hypothetical protein
MPRTDISLTSTELDEFLGECRTAAVAVQGDDGWPIATIGHISAQSGAITIGVELDSPIGAALQAGAHACLVADTWPSYAGIRGVIVRGQAEPRTSAPDTDVHLTVQRLISFDFSKAT